MGLVVVFEAVVAEIGGDRPSVCHGPLPCCSGSSAFCVCRTHKQTHREEQGVTDESSLLCSLSLSLRMP